MSRFSCTCPSDYSPCKHIRIVEEAIAERIANSRRLADTQDGMLTVEELVKNASLQELRDFVVRQAKYNADLTNAVKLEFAHKLTDGNEDEDTNPYSSIISEMMENMELNNSLYHNDYYESDNTEFDDLEQWLEKARNYVEQNNCREAVLICKACIEELTEWMRNTDTDIANYIDIDYYLSFSLEILERAAASPDVDTKELYDYCLSEMNKDKYSRTLTFDRFNDLLAILAAELNADEFIALQDSLLAKVEDRSSRDAERILQREIIFYKGTQQPEKIDALIESNVQIENFRYQIVEKLYAGQRFTEAKNLIEDFIQEKRDTGRDYDGRWDKLLLEIAMLENDIPKIRTVAFSFIKRNFDQKYFDIYKSSFTPDEWSSAMENLLQHYETNSRDFDYRNPDRANKFSSSAASVLIAENAAERLLNYVEKNLSAERMERYYPVFVDLYPEKTLELFEKAVNDYAEKHLGRDVYEYIARLLGKIRQIKNGEKTASAMIANYCVKYKKRRLMIEILTRV
jgi:hypothetical protein